MDISRVHSLFEEIDSENSRLGVPNQLASLCRAYVESSQSPNAETAQGFDNALDALITTVQGAAPLSPNKVRLMSALYADRFYGKAISHHVQFILGDGPTPAKIAEDLNEFNRELDAFYAHVQTAISSFQELLIPLHKTEPGTQVEVVIPTTLFEGNLKGLAKELRSIDMAFGDISEAVTGTRSPINLISTDSGSVELILVIDPVSGAAILSFVTATILLINSIIQNRSITQSLVEQNAPDDVIKALDSWEQARKDEEIDKLKDELLGNFQGDEARKNELNNALSVSLKRLADRLDKGVRIDVSVSTSGEESEDELAALKQIEGASVSKPEITYHEDLILQLNPPDEES